MDGAFSPPIARRAAEQQLRGPDAIRPAAAEEFVRAAFPLARQPRFSQGRRHARPESIASMSQTDRPAPQGPIAVGTP